MFPGLAAALPHIRSGRVRAARGHRQGAQPAAQGRADVRGARLQGLRRACSGTASSGPAGMPRRRRQAPQRHADRGAQGARPAREAVGRGGRADADDARSSSASTSAPTSRAGRSSPRRATSSSTVTRQDMHAMARNTKSPPTTHAPPITAHPRAVRRRPPSRGWSDAVEHEAHRTFLNWLGCAIGAAHHEPREAALAAVQMLAARAAGDACSAARERSTWPAPRWSTASPRTPSTSTTRT